MGKVNLMHDESWRAARLVVHHFHTRLDDHEMKDSLLVVRRIVAEALQRFLERSDREEERLAKGQTKTKKEESPCPPDHGKK